MGVQRLHLIPQLTLVFTCTLVVVTQVLIRQVFPCQSMQLHDLNLWHVLARAPFGDMLLAA